LKQVTAEVTVDEGDKIMAKATATKQAVEAPSESSDGKSKALGLALETI
jgi:hypothetical protein